jgi:hypothetical protein
MGIADWDWRSSIVELLAIDANPQSAINPQSTLDNPNPQSPIANPQSSGSIDAHSIT